MSVLIGHQGAASGVTLTGVAAILNAYGPLWLLPLDDLSGSVAKGVGGSPDGFYTSFVALNQAPIYAGGGPCIFRDGGQYVGMPYSNFPATYDAFSFTMIVRPGVSGGNHYIYATHGDLNSAQLWQFRSNPGIGDIEFLPVYGGVVVHNVADAAMAVGNTVAIGVRVWDPDLDGNWQCDIFINGAIVLSVPTAHRVYPVSAYAIGLGIGTGYYGSFGMATFEACMAAFYTYGVPDSCFADSAAEAGL